MGKKIHISDEEMLAYGDIIESKSYITLRDIIDVYYEFNEDIANDENDSFESSKAVAFNNFSRKFINIRNVFDVEGRIFERNGSHGGYCFSYKEAEFVRELYIRVQTRAIWNEIMAIQRTDQEGFYKAYKRVENQRAFFEEITFFIDGILTVVRTRNNQDSQEHKMRRHLYAVTQYQMIQSHKPIYDVESEIYESLDEIHRLIDKIQVMPPKYIKKLRDKIYSDYKCAIAVLGCEMDNEIFKFRAKIAESILENFIAKKNDGNILKDKKILQKIIDNMKAISPALYSGLTTKNIYGYLHDIEENTQEYLSIYLQEKMEQNPGWEEEGIILAYEIKNHLFDAISKLNDEDFRLLEEDCYKITEF